MLVTDQPSRVCRHCGHTENRSHTHPEGGCWRPGMDAASHPADHDFVSPTVTAAPSRMGYRIQAPKPQPLPCKTWPKRGRY